MMALDSTARTINYLHSPYYDLKLGAFSFSSKSDCDTRARSCGNIVDQMSGALILHGGIRQPARFSGLLCLQRLKVVQRHNHDKADYSI